MAHRTPHVFKMNKVCHRDFFKKQWERQIFPSRTVCRENREEADQVENRSPEALRAGKNPTEFVA